MTVLYGQDHHEMRIHHDAEMERVSSYLQKPVSKHHIWRNESVPATYIVSTLPSATRHHGHVDTAIYPRRPLRRTTEADSDVMAATERVQCRVEGTTPVMRLT